MKLIALAMFNSITYDICLLTNLSVLVSRKFWRPFCSWEREFGLNKDFLHIILLRIELVVNSVQILQSNAMGDHLKWFQIAIANLF